jgi:hypothetical protein
MMRDLKAYSLRFSGMSGSFEILKAEAVQCEPPGKLNNSATHGIPPIFQRVFPYLTKNSRIKYADIADSMDPFRMASLRLPLVHGFPQGAPVFHAHEIPCRRMGPAHAAPGTMLFSRTGFARLKFNGSPPIQSGKTGPEGDGFRQQCFQGFFMCVLDGQMRCRKHNTGIENTVGRHIGHFKAGAVFRSGIGFSEPPFQTRDIGHFVIPFPERVIPMIKVE